MLLLSVLGCQYWRWCPSKSISDFFSLATRPGTTCSWSRRRSSGACLSLCWCISAAVIKYNFSRARWLPSFNSDPFFPWRPIPLVASATGSWCRKLICFFMRLGENGHLYVPYSEFLATRMPESILTICCLTDLVHLDLFTLQVARVVTELTGRCCCWWGHIWILICQQAQDHFPQGAQLARMVPSLLGKLFNFSSKNRVPKRK